MLSDHENFESHFPPSFDFLSQFLSFVFYFFLFAKNKRPRLNFIFCIAKWIIRDFGGDEAKSAYKLDACSNCINYSRKRNKVFVMRRPNTRLKSMQAEICIRRAIDTYINVSPRLVTNNV